MRNVFRSLLPDRYQFGGRLGLQLLIGVVSAFFCWAVRVLLLPVVGTQAPFALVFVGTAVATILGGYRSGLIALVAGEVLVWFSVIEPDGSLVLLPGAVGGLTLSAVAQLLLVLMIALYQRRSMTPSASAKLKPIVANWWSMSSITG